MPDLVSERPPAVRVGPIRLELPPEPALSRVARLAASGVASLAGFSVDEIEDIKVAVSEVMVALIEHGAHQPIAVVFDVVESRFTIRGATPIAEFDIDHPDLVLCRTVLTAVCADHGIELAEGNAEIWASVEQSTA